ncbi:hypothetical protein [Thalassotalea fusca]
MEPEGILLSIFRYFYKKRKATFVEETKPKLKWFPKYVVPLNLPIGITIDADTLEVILAASGFTFQYTTKNNIYFSRGKAWGDLSINYIKINLIFNKELNRNSLIQVEVADVCLFDTGDLWTLSSELATCFSEYKQVEKLKAS